MVERDESEWVGRVVAQRYRLLSCIGSGASARVFRAETLEDLDDVAKGTEVALKVSRAHVLGKHRDAARFLREVQAVRRIDHPSCVQIFDWGIADDVAYIAMELLDGSDLYDVIKREAPMTCARAIAITIELCHALIAAHAEGVVHRDLKPRNIVMLPNGEGGVLEPRLKVLDFGLAKLFLHGVDEEETLPDALTKPGSVLGTPHYMAPEQVRVDGVIDGRADLYAVSVILYELLTDRRPYRAKNAVRLLVLRSNADPDPPSTIRADLDPELEAIVMRGLARDPGDRFESALAYQRALADILPRLAEEEAVAPSSSFHDGADESIALAEAARSRRPSSMPPDTIDDQSTEHDPSPPVRDLVERPVDPPHRRAPDRKQLFYYAVTVVALAATVARLVGLW